MKIIAFSGKKQSGKNTVVRDLCSRPGEEAEIINFADALKELVFRFFAAPTKEYANTMWEPFITETSKERIHPCGKTYREILQVVGTDWCRTLWSEMWIENYKFRVSIAEKDPEVEIILTTDVRFPNEVACVQKLGGHVIRLLRAPFPDDKHESETALDMPVGFLVRGDYKIGIYHYGEYQTPSGEMVKIDAFVDNKNMTIAEQNEAIWQLIQGKKWI